MSLFLSVITFFKYLGILVFLPVANGTKNFNEAIYVGVIN